MRRQKWFEPGRFVPAALAAVGLLAFQAWANPISKDDAVRAVSGWLRQPGRGLATPLGNSVKEAHLFTDAAGQPSFYVVYLNPSGFAIMPADDRVEPIIAFSPSPRFVNSDSNPLGALVRRDLPERIAAARARPQAPSRIAAQKKWAMLKSAAAQAAITGPSITDLRVAPLTQSLWSEDTVDDLPPPQGVACYNYYTPPGPDGSANNYPCGCVATAMAMLMYFWQYPAAGVGAESFTIYVGNNLTPQTATLLGGDGSGGPYQWSNMVAVPNSSTTLTQREAIGALCFDAGVTVGMEYQASGSGAWLSDAATALQDTFMFNNVIAAEDDASPTYVTVNMGPPSLIGMINPNLDAGLPVILAIYGPVVGGHAVVADGYGYDSGTLYHHLNMGWSGTDNAWYNLPNVYADPLDVFNAVENCLYNIYETGSGEIISGRVVDTSGNAISGVTVTAAGISGTNYSAVTTTNAEGIYAFTQVPSAGSFTLTASASNRWFLPLNETTGTSTNYVTTSGNVWGANFADLGAPPTGSLRVTLQPAAADTAGARWNVDGLAWQTSGAMVTGLSLGSHTVNFNTIAGWNSPSPASQPVTIAYNTTTFLTATYVQQTGSVEVTLGPADAVSAGAQWNLDGGAWQASGVTLAGVPVGNYTVNFSTLYGWNTPAVLQNVTVYYNGLTTASGTYVEQTGDLTITLQPSGAVGAGAQWRVDGGTWQNSQATVTGLLVPVAHTVDYLPVTAWAEPPSESVAILNNLTTALTRTYVADLTPPSVSDEYPAPGDTYVDPSASVKLRINDPVSGVNLSTVRITASRDGGTTSETICDGSNLTPAAPTAGLASSGAPYAGWYDATANGNTVFKGRTYIGGTAPGYVFLFEPDTDAAFGFDETVAISVSASDWAGNTMTPSSAGNPPSLYNFMVAPRSFGDNLRADVGTAGDDFPAAATDGAGNVWVAWERMDAATQMGTIWLAERQDPADAWSFGSEIPVTTVLQNGDCRRPAIAVSGDTIYVAYEVHGATPSIGVLKATVPTPPAQWTWTSVGPPAATFMLQAAPAIAADSAGNVNVAGTGADAVGVQQIGLATLAAGATTWTVTKITSSPSNQAGPAIAEDATGIVYLLWTSTADNNLYGADSSSAWTTIHKVTNNGAAGSPEIATETAGNVLHFVWAVAAANPDIQYADTSGAGGGWPATPLTSGTSILTGSGITGAANPRIAATGTTSGSANAQVFVLWQGSLSNAPGDADIWFSERMWNGQFYPMPVLVSAVPAGLGLATASARNPTLGVNLNGAPYAAWTDLREGGASHIYFAEATGAAWPPSRPLLISSSGIGAGSPAQFMFPSSPHFTEVDVAVPNDAFSTSINLTVNELSNPPVECPGGSGLFASDGSGLYLDITGGSGCGGMDSDGDLLGDWITVTIHLKPGAVLPSPLMVYRLVPPTAGSLGSYAWTADWIRNVSYSAATNELKFDTAHLSSFGVGAAPASGGGGGGGGGCAMSPGGEPDLFLILLPLAALGVWVAARRAGRPIPNQEEKP